tara:strand:+ start:34 stop:528 length:495 start_codon:yes stop_codon:yes gene_type:complete
MAVHNKKLVTKKFPQGNKIGTTPVQKTVPGPYGTTKTKTYQKPQVGKTTTAGRNLTKKRALISKEKKLSFKSFNTKIDRFSKIPGAKKIPVVGKVLRAISIAKKVKKIVKAKKAINDPYSINKSLLNPLRTPYPSLRNDWINKTLGKLYKKHHLELYQHKVKKP